MYAGEGTNSRESKPLRDGEDNGLMLRCGRAQLDFREMLAGRPPPFILVVSLLWLFTWVGETLQSESKPIMAELAESRSPGDGEDDGLMLRCGRARLNFQEKSAGRPPLFICLLRLFTWVGEAPQGAVPAHNDGTSRHQLSWDCSLRHPYSSPLDIAIIYVPKMHEIPKKHCFA